MDKPQVVAWRRGGVDRSVQHFVLSYAPEGDPRDRQVYLPVALVGPPHHGSVNVEFIVDESDPAVREAIAAVVREIEFYLIELDHPNRWRYCVSHCSTMANVYSQVCWEGYMSELELQVLRFDAEISRLRGFDNLSFSVGELRRDPNWSWGFDRGVYCFLVEDEVVYVGRAVGKSLGERIADQLRQQSDPEWAKVVTTDDNRVEVFAVPKERAFVAAALEVYLIRTLQPRPRFNLRIG